MCSMSIGSGPQSLAQLRSQQNQYAIQRGQVQQTAPTQQTTPQTPQAPPQVDRQQALQHRQQLSQQLRGLTDTSAKIDSINARFEALGASKIEDNSKGFWSRLGRSLLKVGKAALGGIAKAGLGLAKLAVKGANLVSFFKFSQNMESAVNTLKDAQQSVGKWVDGAAEGPSLNEIGEDFTGSDQVDTEVDVDDVAFEPVGVVGEYMGTNVNASGLTDQQLENLQNDQRVTGGHDPSGAGIGIAAGILTELTAMSGFDQAVENFEDAGAFNEIVKNAKTAIRTAQQELMLLRDPAESETARELKLLESPQDPGHGKALLQLRDQAVAGLNEDIQALASVVSGQPGLTATGRVMDLVDKTVQRLEDEKLQGHPLSPEDQTLLDNLQANPGTPEYQDGLMALQQQLSDQKGALEQAVATDPLLTPLKDARIGVLQPRLTQIESDRNQLLTTLQSGTDPAYSGKSLGDIQDQRVKDLNKQVLDMQTAVRRARSARTREAMQGVLNLTSSLNSTAQAVNGFINAHAALQGEAAGSLALSTQQVGGIFTAVTATASMVQDTYGAIRNGMRIKRSDAYLKAPDKNAFIANSLSTHATELKNKAQALPDSDPNKARLTRSATEMENQALAFRNAGGPQRSETSQNIEKAVTLMRKNQKQSAWVKAFSAVKNAVGAAGAIALTVVSFSAAAALAVSPVGWALAGVAAVAGVGMAVYCAYKSIKRSDDIATVRTQMQQVNAQIQKLETEKTGLEAQIKPPSNTVDPTSPEGLQIKADIEDIDARLVEFKALKADIKGVLLETDPQAAATELIKVLNQKDPATNLPTPEAIEVATVMREVFAVQPEALDTSQLNTPEGTKMFEDTTKMLGKKLSMFYTK